MITTDFDYYLPEERIAQTPAEPRDSSKMLVYNRADKSIEHKIFHSFPDYLKKGDVLVINDTKVIPARLFGTKDTTGSVIEFLLLNRRDNNVWEILVRPGKRARIGAQFTFGDKLKAEIIDILDDGQRLARFSYEGRFENILDELGIMPLPPYIKEKLEDKDRYQTVYAQNSGSAAAPTAGLHFTNELMDKIRDMGVTIVPVTLHVGLGTFRPVAVEKLEDHKMHSEFYSVSEETANIINEAKKSGNRIISVGTTSTRVLESVADEEGVLKPCSGWTDIFIYPGYKWKCVDALLTNFHLPQSTLLMLVSSLIGRDELMRVYKLAIDEKYRFYSFGDCCLFL